MTNPDNAGLEVPIVELATLLASSSPLSRADLWALAGVVAARSASQKVGTVNFKSFNYGRIDCTTADREGRGGPNRVLPSPNADFSTTSSYFAAEFGFNVEETVVILGVHALGKAARTNSGFASQWQSRVSFDATGFYSSILQGWQQSFTDNSALAVTPRIPDRYIWRRGANNANFMTNSDLSMAWDFVNSNGANALNAATGQVSCIIGGGGGNNACRSSIGRDHVVEYSTNNTAWLTDFEPTFYKMINMASPGTVLQVVV